MKLSDITVVVAVDVKTAQQLEVSWRTWCLHRPEMWEMPWLVIFDKEAPNGLDSASLATFVRDRMKVKNFSFYPWPQVRTTYPTQREKMLTAFVHAVERVQTPWWMKIDTDCLALGQKLWLQDEWFEPLACDQCGRNVVDRQKRLCQTCQNDPLIGTYNAWIASPWHYTKPAEQMGQLDDWGDTVPELMNHPRLNLSFEPGARRVGHKRMCSWLSFYRTDWSNEVREWCPWYKLPVPSQDGYHFYCAHRRGDRYRRVKMKRFLWTNVPRLEKLKMRAGEVLGGTV